jgi:hypothetical protein
LTISDFDVYGTTWNALHEDDITVYKTECVARSSTDLGSYDWDWYDWDAEEWVEPNNLEDDWYDSPWYFYRMRHDSPSGTEYYDNSEICRFIWAGVGWHTVYLKHEN